MDDSRISHRGNVYGVGQGEDHYGVWDLRAGGDPVARYEMTPEGWIQAWSRYQELERLWTPGWRSPGVGWILLHLLIALAIWFLVTSVTLVAVEGVDRPEPSDAAAIAALVGLIPGVAGWFLFVYLSRSLGIRWLALLAGSAIQVGVITIASLAWGTF